MVGSCMNYPMTGSFDGSGGFLHTLAPPSILAGHASKVPLQQLIELLKAKVSPEQLESIASASQHKVPSANA